MRFLHFLYFTFYAVVINTQLRLQKYTSRNYSKFPILISINSVYLSRILLLQTNIKICTKCCSLHIYIFVALYISLHTSLIILNQIAKITCLEIYITNISQFSLSHYDINRNIKVRKNAQLYYIFFFYLIKCNLFIYFSFLFELRAHIPICL